MRVVGFELGPFAENTYFIIDDATNECLVIDPGCYWPQERQTLIDYLETHKLTPVRLLNTHCHIDHVFGNRLFLTKYGLLPEYHRLEDQVLKSGYNRAEFFGLKSMEESPSAERFLSENDELLFGKNKFKLLFTPGHSPGSLCFYCAEENFIIGGDVLFFDSIGRTDLPGGNHDTLMRSIFTQLMPLPLETEVYPGHGPATTIGREKAHNPFLRP